MTQLDGGVIEVYRRRQKPSFGGQEAKRPVLTADEARELYAALAASSRHEALDSTRVDLGGLLLQGAAERRRNNPKITRIGRSLAALDKLRDDSLPKRLRDVPDAYYPALNVVSLPSYSPGILMHELGHAIDFNEFPSDSRLRQVLAAAYRQAPASTLWKEHAAWRKGKDRTLQAYANDKLDPKLTYKVLENASRFKPSGLGSYWGAGLGSLGGVGLGHVLAKHLQNASGFTDNPFLNAYGIVAGEALGALSGASLGLLAGNYLSRGKVDEAKIKKSLVKAVAKHRGIPYGDAEDQVERQFEKSGEEKQQKDGKTAASPSLAIPQGSATKLFVSARNAYSDEQVMNRPRRITPELLAELRASKQAANPLQRKHTQASSAGYRVASKRANVKVSGNLYDDLGQVFRRKKASMPKTISSLLDNLGVKDLPGIEEMLEDVFSGEGEKPKGRTTIRITMGVCSPDEKKKR